ncbi:MAG: endonuclease V [Thaumarchaeota archaeon]|nr:endonuclease V [Nitrososphaerota archaeon]
MHDRQEHFFDEHHVKFFEWLQETFVSSSQDLAKLRDVSTIVGVDVAYGGDVALAAAVGWSVNESRVTDVSLVRSKPVFPYKTGFLFLREAPIMVAATKGIRGGFDLVLVDGHGIAHPRRAGLAVFVGAALGKPSLGVAKSLLIGDLGSLERGFQKIFVDGSLVGYCVKPKGSRRYFASPGFGLSVEDVAYLLDKLGEKYPEALKQAHKEAKKGLTEIG